MTLRLETSKPMLKNAKLRENILLGEQIHKLELYQRRDSLVFGGITK